ncbi:MAG: hypothetical protein EOO43_18990, partial [Flavobacterium sp.]
YNIEFLVYYEKFGWIQQAIEREKEIKDLSRMKKLDLIRTQNPNLDFYNHLFYIHLLSYFTESIYMLYTHFPLI